VHSGNELWFKNSLRGYLRIVLLPSSTCRTGSPAPLNCYRLVDGLVSSGYLAREPARKRLTVGSRLTDLAFGTMRASMRDAGRHALLRRLADGSAIALVSDAGTPLVSDPGFKLVRDALANKLPVTAVPGPSAALTALLLSGLPPEVFLFAGFLPPRSAARRRMLAQWATTVAPLVVI